MIAAARDYEARRREVEAPYERWPITVHPKEEVGLYRRTYRGELNIQFQQTPELAIAIPVPPPGQYRYRVTIEPLNAPDELWTPR